jgi:thioredoxin-dependent peroxiredoxin
MQAPLFTLPDQNGKRVSLSEFGGQTVVLYFYPKADTPGCTAQACGMRDNMKVFRDRNVAVIGISPDDVSDLKHFEKKYNLNFTLLADPNHDVLEMYGVWKEKSFMGRHFMGVERTTILIDEKGEIIKRYNGVNPVAHAGMIIADITKQPLPAQPKAPMRSMKKPRKVAKKAPRKAKKAPAKKLAKRKH